MVYSLKNLGEPSEFWEYFEILTTIPRCSGNEAQVREYIKSEANNLGFSSKVDSIGNLVVNIPTKILPAKINLILQCHLDMVCEKNELVEHDFSKDPLKLKTIEIEGEKWVAAEGTTLGADDGFGIAIILALMKKISNKELILENISLELLFTVDEERGLIGAFQIDKKLIHGDILINLDSDLDDTFTVGCAGGIRTSAEIKVDWMISNNLALNTYPMKLMVEGLIGGHSGVDIHRGRGNGIKILSKILWKVNETYQIDVVSINGGNRDNVIPREANAIILINKEKRSEITDFIHQIISEIQLGISKIEPNLKILVKPLESLKIDKYLAPNIKNKLLHILYIMPNGPISYHPDTKGLVYTSTNLASIKTEETLIRIITSQRSLHEISKKIIYEQIEALLKLAELNIEIQHAGEYPGWPPDWDSPLLKNSKEMYTTLFNESPKIRVIHAGLESGILKKHFPQIDTISIGPTAMGVHSPDEKLKVKSISKIWKFLIELLKKYN